MPIPVEIEGGITLSFPDGTPDEAIDAAVQRLVGGGSAAPKAPGDDGDMTLALMQMLGEHANKIQANRQKQHETDGEYRANRLKTQVIAAGAQVDATKEGAETIAQMLADVANGVIPALGELPDKESAQQIVVAVNNLSATITEVGTAIINVLMMPAQIAHDKSGTPKAIGRKRSEIDGLL